MKKFIKNAPHKENMNVQRATSKKKMSLLGLIVMVMCVISLGIFMQSCSRYDEPDTLDSSIVNSTEMEEYIIAGSDLQQSLADFTAELNKIDFSKLEVSYEQGWKKVVHLPVVPYKIEKKVQIFNEKKKELFNKFPEFACLKKETKEKFFRQTIKNSVNVQGEFLKLGIKTTTPLLKSDPEVNGSYQFMDRCYLMQFLGSWATTGNLDYLELWIIKYEDGRYATYQHPGAGVDSEGYYTPHPDWEVGSDGQWYFPEGGSSSRVVEVGHTHIRSENPTPINDEFPVPSGVDRFIYYNHGMNYY
jgi:hypothetical protein